MVIPHPFPLEQKSPQQPVTLPQLTSWQSQTCNPQEKDARHHAQSASRPPQEDSDWSEEDWDSELRQKQRKERLEKASGYYPPDLKYDPSLEREVPVLVTDPIPAPVPREIKSKSQRGKEEEERIENRRIVEGTDDDEDLDYYSGLDTIYESCL